VVAGLLLAHAESMATKASWHGQDQAAIFQN